MGRQLASLATRGASSLPEEDENHPAHKAVQYTSEIDGHDTSVLVQPFDDRVFICVSQNGRIGTMISAELENTPRGASTVNVKVLMGKRDSMMLELVARRILDAMIHDGCNKPLLLSIALRAHDLAAVDPIVAAVVDAKAW